MVELHKRRVDEMVKAENKRKANELEEKRQQDEAKKKEKWMGQASKAVKRSQKEEERNAQERTLGYRNHEGKQDP